MRDFIWAMVGFVLCLAFPDVKWGVVFTLGTVAIAKVRDL